MDDIEECTKASSSILITDSGIIIEERIALKKAPLRILSNSEFSSKVILDNVEYAKA